MQYKRNNSVEVLVAAGLLAAAVVTLAIPSSASAEDEPWPFNSVTINETTDSSVYIMKNWEFDSYPDLCAGDFVCVSDTSYDIYSSSQMFDYVSPLKASPMFADWDIIWIPRGCITTVKHGIDVVSVVPLVISDHVITIDRRSTIDGVFLKVRGDVPSLVLSMTCERVGAFPEHGNGDPVDIGVAETAAPDAPPTPVTADLLALYVGKTLHWYPGKGDGTFWSARDEGPAAFKAMALGNMDGDGRPDLLAVYTDNTLHWYPGRGDGTFWSARDLGTANFKLVALADINGDGKADMMAVYDDSTLHWYPGKGDGSFWSARDMGPANFKLLSLADINHDGKADMIAVYNDNTLHWYPGKGDGTFWSARDLGTANFRAMAFADLDGDGKVDMMAVYDDGTLHWYPGKGDGTFWSARNLGNANFEMIALANIG